MAFNKFYLHLIRYGIYLILWHIFESCKNVCWILFKGTSKIPLNHARIHKILFRFKLSPGENTRKEDFISVDDGFISIDEFFCPNWTIYSLDKKKVLFAEMPKPISDYTIDKYPFIYQNLFQECIRVAEIDFKEYLKLAEKYESEINYIPPKCLLITNTARSASTLFGSMLQHSGHSTVFGEHPALTTIAIGFCQGFWNENDVMQLLNSTIKILRKNFPPNHLLIFKARSIETFLVPFLSKQFPEIQHIFMFRKNGLKSVEKMLSLGDSIYINMCQMYIHFPSLMKCLTSLIWNTFKELKPATILEASIITFAEPYFNYKKYQILYNFPIIWQHELIEAPEKVLAPIFEKFEIPDTFIPAAIDRMKYDSQDGTFLSQKIMKKYSATKNVTPELKEKILVYAKHFEIEPNLLGIFDD